ncbi:hypothetical protein [Caldivirga maquilingensis]|uniref:Uncharacterized protein n=1 Tax=Caldivirga maquilingensis (strain ATCC 700844 / DSM 13496 / JCM 10307 / IC-167) TaxID=397948 RepID=A8MDD3_CALMQ|nr:hypothetical protein [Caldivirga maquilingensis]ABW01789.1 hypothetical protein Cmaq_0957 [Caldivirga maquilingensis IC-167]
MQPTDPIVVEYINELMKRGLRQYVDLIIPSDDVFKIGREYAETRRSYAELLDALIQYVKPRINGEVAEQVVRNYLGNVNVDYVDVVARGIAKWYVGILRLFNVVSFSGYQPP